MVSNGLHLLYRKTQSSEGSIGRLGKMPGQIDANERGYL